MRPDRRRAGAADRSLPELLLTLGHRASGGLSRRTVTVRRLARLATGQVRSGSGQPGAAEVGPRRAVLRAAAVLGALALAVVVSGWVGPVLAVPAGYALDRWLQRVEPAGRRRRRLREEADLPLAADLLAAVLRAGAPVDRSVLEVAQALAGPLGARLDQVGRTLALGGGPDEAWGRLAEIRGGDRLASAAVRSAASGTALSRALTRLADDLRADRAGAAEAAARRSAVLVVLPLGLCFLPAFVLAGLAPVIIAVLGDVL